MCASWNNAEIKIEKVSKREVKLQAERALREECDKAIRDMKKAVKSCEVKEGQTILEYVNQCENAINDICYSLKRVLLALNDSDRHKHMTKSLYRQIYDNLYNHYSGEAFFRLAKDCTKYFDRWVEMILNSDPEEEDFEDIERYKYLIGKSRKNSSNVFLEFANSMVWIGENSAGKFNRWFGADCKREIFNKLGHRVSAEYEPPREYSKDMRGAVNKVLVGVFTLFLENEDSVLPSTMQKIDGWEEVVKRRFTRADVTKDIQDRKEANALIKKTI